MQKLRLQYVDVFDLLHQFSKGYSQKGLHMLELDVPFAPRAYVGYGYSTYFDNPNFSSYSARYPHNPFQGISSHLPSSFSRIPPLCTRLSSWWTSLLLHWE